MIGISFIPLALAGSDDCPGDGGCSPPWTTRTSTSDPTANAREYNVDFVNGTGLDNCYSNSYPSGFNYTELIQSGTVMQFGNSGVLSGNCEIFYWEWNLRSTEGSDDPWFPAGRTTVETMELWIWFSIGTDEMDCDSFAMEHRFSYYGANATAFGEDVLNGTQFLVSDGLICNEGNLNVPTKITMPASAITDLQANLDEGADWWALSFAADDWPESKGDPDIRYDDNVDLNDDPLVAPWADLCDQDDIPPGTCSNAGGVWLMMNYTLTPEPVDDLAITANDHITVNLDWTEPDWYGWKDVDPSTWADITTGYADFEGYQVNRSAAGGGSPLTIITETTTADTDFLVTSLDTNTEYSFRVSAITRGGQLGVNQINASGNIVTVTTDTFFQPTQNLTGIEVFNATNPNMEDILFTRTDINTTHISVDVDRPIAYNLACNLDYKYAQFDHTFTSPTTIVLDANTHRSTFTFVNSTSEVINMFCWDQSGSDTGRYILTQTGFPFLDQIIQFRAGDFGTSGNLGAFDLISLFAIVLIMLGMNRVNPTVGVIISVSLIGTLGFFEIVSLPSVIISALAVVVMLVVASTRKVDG